MSVDKEKQETAKKTVTKYDKKMQRRAEEAAQAKKEKTIWSIVGIVALVALLGVIAIGPIKRAVALNSAYVKIGDHKITRVEYDYYYNLTVNNFISNYSQYLSYFGLDTSADYSKQSYNEYLTWKDHFDEMTVSTITESIALNDAAKAAGFTYDASADYDDFIQLASDTAKSAGTTLGAYLKTTFGTYATKSRLKPYVLNGYVASKYYEQVMKEKAPADSEIQSYYDENKQSYDSVVYQVVTIDAEGLESKTVTAEDGSTSTVEPTEEEITAAMEAACEKADAARDTVEAEGVEFTNKYNAISSVYRSWLFEDRKAGDVEVFADNTKNCYYAVRFVRRFLSDAKTASFRVIITTEDKGQEIMNKFNAAGATEDAFIGLVKEYSQDSSAVTNDGLYEDMMTGTLTAELENWVWADERQAGDCETFTVGSNTFVIYFLGLGREEWKASISDTLTGTVMTEYVDGLKAAYSVSDPNGNLTYIERKAAQEAAEAASAGATE